MVTKRPFRQAHRIEREYVVLIVLLVAIAGIVLVLTTGTPMTGLPS